MSSSKSKKTIIIIALLTITGFGYSYYSFKKEVEKESQFLKQTEANSLHELLAAYDSTKTALGEENEDFAEQFRLFYNVTSAEQEKFKKVKSFIFSEEISYKLYNKGFLIDLKTKAKAEAYTLKAKKDLLSDINKLNSHDKSIFDQIDEKEFFKEADDIPRANKVWPNLTGYHYNKKKIIDYIDLVKKVKSKKQNLKNKNDYQKSLLRKAQTPYQYGFSSYGLNMFNLIKNDPKYLKYKSDFHTIISKALNTKINFQYENVKFDKESFDEDLNEIFAKQYANNSLRTGAQPYGNCYGYNRSCDSYGCSKIKVKGPSNSDVLVLIKKSGKVYRHAYIDNGGTVSLEMPNGYYQAFFYYGKGWNPNKEMKYISGYGTLRGGFTSNEDWDKDDAQYLSNNVLRYELILQTNGNLQTKASSMNEAL